MLVGITNQIQEAASADGLATDETEFIDQLIAVWQEGAEDSAEESEEEEETEEEEEREEEESEEEEE